MKLIKFAFAAALALSAGSASAFHDGGVAYCEGCHTMHNSRNGAPMGPGTQFVGKTYLLQGTDQSSTCLICHGKGTGGYNVFTNASATVTPKNWTPGGDFGWIKLGDRSWTYPRAGANVAQARGHNVVAADKGVAADTRFVTAPGGVFPANQLHCSACHDPHGKYRLTVAGTYDANPGFTKGAPSLAGAAVKSVPIHASGSYGEAPTATAAVGAYRLLAGVGYRPASVADAAGIPFVNDPPVAVAPSTYNRSEAVTDTHVAYGKGMSEWCANCHGAIHNDSYPTALIHPAGNNAKLSAETYQNYNAYVASGDMTGSFATAYSSLVPFEVGSVDTVALLAKTLTTDGAAATDNVSCLSCHRAHASGFESMTRWNNRAEFLTVEGQYASNSGVATGTGELFYGNISNGYTSTEYQAAMYDRPATKFATFQRSLCNKCHAKD